MLFFLDRPLITLIAISTLATTYLYLYPIVHGCSFPTPNAYSNAPSRSSLERYIGPAVSIAPFRLLVLGDPQLEGDSSLPGRDYNYFPSVSQLVTDIFHGHAERGRFFILKHELTNLFTRDLPFAFFAFRKRLDLLGNDFYLAHIYRTLYTLKRPTHVAVVGDLIGSQWVRDEEFERRGWRYWQRVFNRGHRVEDRIASDVRSQSLGEDKIWQRRVISVAGNHDIGYAGDMTAARIERFERLYGKANWETLFHLPQAQVVNITELDTTSVPELRIIVLNSLNLDTPALDEELQANTYKFINDAISASKPVEDRTTATVLLTHLPLHKEAGVCVDAPFFAFHNDERRGVKEQNHLSYEAGKGILEAIYGMSGDPNAPGGGRGRNGIILTGHDHEGCDVYHHLPQEEDVLNRRWKAVRWSEADNLVEKDIPGIREVTVRSMMGEFGGNAGLVSAWFDYDIGEWRMDYSSCSLGKQHIWWAVHILDLITFAIFFFKIGGAAVWRKSRGPTESHIGKEKDNQDRSVASKGGATGSGHGANRGVRRRKTKPGI
ncbi:hypothetical protein MMC20_007435 [Loxospora ochrophaea]|nr:hypothetical protein [Loxospora ochrophaea]